MSTDEHLVDTLAYAAVAELLGQLVFFGVAAKAFAITEGLLPEDESFDRWFKFVTRERVDCWRVARTVPPESNGANAHRGDLRSTRSW
jgi:hypothetical protein